MRSIPVSQFKATCLGLFKKLSSGGEPVLVTKGGRAVALVSPPPKPRDRGETFGAMKAATILSGDIVSPLPESAWEVLKP